MNLNFNFLKENVLFDWLTAGSVLAGWIVVALSITFLGLLALLAEEFVNALDRFLNPPLESTRRGLERKRQGRVVSSPVQGVENDLRGHMEER